MNAIKLIHIVENRPHHLEERERMRERKRERQRERKRENEGRTKSRNKESMEFGAFEEFYKKGINKGR